MDSSQFMFEKKNNLIQIEIESEQDIYVPLQLKEPNSYHKMFCQTHSSQTKKEEIKYVNLKFMEKPPKVPKCFLCAVCFNQIKGKNLPPEVLQAIKSLQKFQQQHINSILDYYTTKQSPPLKQIKKNLQKVEKSFTQQILRVQNSFHSFFETYRNQFSKIFQTLKQPIHDGKLMKFKRGELTEGMIEQFVNNDATVKKYNSLLGKKSERFIQQFLQGLKISLQQIQKQLKAQLYQSQKMIKLLMKSKSTQIRFKPNQIKSKPTQIRSKPNQIKSKPTQIRSEPNSIKSKPTQIRSKPNQIKSKTSQIKYKPSQNTNQETLTSILEVTDKILQNRNILISQSLNLTSPKKQNNTKSKSNNLSKDSNTANIRSHNNQKLKIRMRMRDEQSSQSDSNSLHSFDRKPTRNPDRKKIPEKEVSKNLLKSHRIRKERCQKPAKIQNVKMVGEDYLTKDKKFMVLYIVNKVHTEHTESQSVRRMLRQEFKRKYPQAFRSYVASELLRK